MESPPGCVVSGRSAGSVCVNRGKRLRKRFSKAITSATTRYLWDGKEVLAELDAQGNLLRSYVHGSVIDEILYQEDYPKSETLFFPACWAGRHQDQLMSTLALTDSQGIVKESFTYDPYGNLLKAEDREGLPAGEAGRFLLDPSTSFLYTGRELDSETGLYYNRARFYDPQLGRFITTDPKGYEAGLNLYTYTRNNPLSFNDPLGLDVGCSGGGWYSGAWGAVSSAARHVYNAVSSAVSTVTNVVSSVVGAVASTVAHVASSVASAVSKTAGAIAEGVTKVADTIADKISSIPIVPNVIRAIGGAIAAPFQIVSSVAEGIGSAIEALGSKIARISNNFQQILRNNFFRPEGAKPVLGKERSILPPGKGLGLLIEDFIPAAHEFAVLHDAIVGVLAPESSVFHPANIPTMLPAYVAAVAGAVANTAVELARS